MTTAVLQYATIVTHFVAEKLASVLLPLQSDFSAASLFCALCVAVVSLLLSRRPEKRSVSYRVMFRALFPSWLYRNASFKADIVFFLFNVLAFGALFGWATFSASIISHTVSGALATAIGASPDFHVNGVASYGIAAISLFLAYETAYWLDHYLSHRIPLLWEFHRVHHTAEVLSPLTNFRVHPVDSIVFGNILGVFIGTTHGVLSYMRLVEPGAGAEGSVIAVAGMWILGHLQHSHIWMSTTGRLGRVILSPAHHQIHHSENPKHFNKNFGAFLSIWDWMFGTLCIPQRNREYLTFGVGHHSPHEHTVVGGMLTPFVMAWRRVTPRPLAPSQRRDALAEPNL